MKKSLLILLLFSIPLFSQSKNDDCVTLAKIKTLLQEYHYKPKPINDSLSVYVFKNFLQKLDENNSLFTEAEINYLNKYKLKIDNQIITGNCDFLTDFYNTYNKAVQRYNSIINTIIKEDFPLSSKELIRFYSKSRPYLKTENELKHLYQKRMLMDVLLDVASLSKNKDSLQTVFTKTALVSKAKVFDSYSCKASKFKLSASEFSQKFFAVFCSYYDPHTEYFNQNDKSSFLAAISSDNLTFGIMASLDKNEKIIVQEIIPGSAAFYSRKIEIGDEIIKIKSKEEEIYVGCTNIEKIEKLLSSSDHKWAEFFFRKKNGENYSLALVKKVMKDYQNNVYSFILEKENQKMGYIKIPSFYTNIENGKTNMSDDVMKEIVKLQEEKVNGLILDLENNGGGSLLEAIKLCGLFINDSAVGIQQNRIEGNTLILNKVINKIYTGPIIILINGFSASASEFFTNAMQDYNLAIILGTKSLGKATIQQILPLEGDNNQFVKVTLGKFYSVTGKSNQYNGITPTIEIPSLFQNQYPKENSYPTAFKNDVIKSDVRFNAYTTSEKDKKIIQTFKDALKTDADIQKTKALNVELDQLYKGPYQAIPLNFSSVFKQLNSINTLWTKIKTYNEIEYPFTITNTQYDSQYIKYDEYYQTVNQNNIKTIKGNLTIFEAVKLMSNLNKN